MAKTLRPDWGEMHVAATAALGIFDRVQIDPAHLLALIDTADDLGAALESLIEGDGHIRACGNGGENPEDCSPECNRATAALARARGETP
jgi:hypothetical protein